MTTPNEEEIDKDSAVEQGQEAQTYPPAQVEAKEQEPQLTLKVAGACENPDGRFVGLNAKQREALGVTVGGSVVLKGADGKSLGLFTVGKGSSKFVKQPDVFTANVVATGETFTVTKAKENSEEAMSLNVQHGIENPPADLSDQDKEKHKEKTAKRFDIIKGRFGADSDAFITIPTAVLNQLTGDTNRIAQISKVKIRYGGKEMLIVAVPAGTDFGLTTLAAERLGIPAELRELRLGVDQKNGVLVIA